MTTLRLKNGCVHDDIAVVGSLSDDAAMLGLRARAVEREILHFA